MSKPARVESRAYCGIVGWSYKNKKPNLFAKFGYVFAC